MMSKITRDLIIEYQNRKINREDLMNATGLSESRIREVLRRANVKVWDLKITDRQTMDRLCNLYKKKKMTRAEICKNFNIKKENLDGALAYRQIDIWDRIYNKRSKVLPKKKYYDWREFKDSIFYSYNK